MFESGKIEKYAALIFGLAAFLIYALFSMQTFYWDGIIYARFIEDTNGFGANLFHANHLLYNFLGYAAYHTVRIFKPDVRALFVLQYVTCFFGGLCAAVFFFDCRKTVQINLSEYLADRDFCFFRRLVAVCS